MAEVIIAEVNGEASLVRSETGEQVNVTVGMTVAKGDVLNISPDGFVTVSVDGELRTLPAGQSVTFPLQLDFTENNSDDEFAVFDESVDELTALLYGVDGVDGNNQEGDADFLDVLAGDGDILESLEATAAGLDGGAGTDGGSNFVRVDRINEEVSPVGFQFDQNANGNDDVTPVEFSGTGEQAQDISLTLDAIGLTSDTTPTLSGITSAIPGSTVTLTVTDSEGNTQVVTAIVQDDGTFSVDVPNALADGEFTVDATVLEPTGNTADSSTTGEIDATAPTITINAPGSDNDTTPTLSGTTDATPGSTVTLTITDSAGVTQTVTAIVQADGTYSADVPAELAEGEFTVNASVTDEAGNTANAEAQGAIDVTAPTISLNDPGINGDATPTLSGLTDAVPGSTITLTVTDSAGVTQTFTTTVLADGTFTVEIPNAVAEGTYGVIAEVTDGAGNTAQATASGDYDSTSPSTTVNQPAPTNDTTPNVSGETDAPPGSEVVIVVTDSEGNEQTIVTTVGADGTFNEDVPAELSEGEYTVDVTVTTPAGNSSITTVTGEIDTTAPIIILDPIGSTNDDTPVINGDTDAEPGAIVTLDIVHSDGTTQTITAIVQEDGSFSAEVPQALANGDFTVTATVSDVAGNTASTSIDAVINTQGPNVVIETGSPTNGSEGIGGSSDAPNSEVVVVITDSDGNSQTITGTTDENGNFNVAFPPGSEEGEYEIEVTVTDENGNSTTATATTVLDTTPPIVNIDPQTDTNDTTPTISGNTDLPAGSEVVITVTDNQGNTQTVTAVVDENGNFSADIEEALAEGNYEVSVEATDAAGNTTTAVDNSGNIDTTAPPLSLDPQTDGSDTTPTISGSTDLPPGSTVTIAVTDSAGNTQTIDAIVDENGDFSVDVQTPLTEGEYIVEASATDEAGNTTTVTENGGNIDTQAPTISLEPLGTGNDTTPSISGATNLEVGSTVTLTVTDSAGNSQTFTATVDANGKFSADVPAELADGNYTVEATATDAAGNSASTTQTGSVDSNAPSLTLDPLGDDNDTTPTISGTTDLPAGSTVTLSVTDALGNTQTFTATVDGSGNFSVDVPNPLAEGEYSVTATATDANGNTATATETGGNIDITSPLVNLDAQGSTNDTTPTISGNTDQAPSSSVSITVTDSAGNTQTFDALVQNDGTFSVDVPAELADGNFTVTATVTDDAGNQDSATTQGNIDTAAPTLSLDPQDIGSDTTPLISGTTDLPQGSTVTLVVTDSLGNQQTIEAVVDENGGFSAEVPSALAEGNYSVTATAVDGNGNTASVTENGGIIDTTAPLLTLNPVGSGNDSTPTLSGSTDLPEGSVVSLTVVDSAGNTQTINTLVDANGNFSVDVPQELADGDYAVTATAEDEAGNEASDNATGNINTNAPTLVLDGQGETNDSTPTISGTTSLPEGSTVTLTVTDSAGNTQTITATVGTDGTFSADVTAPLADGAYTVTASATDGDGNTTTVTDNGGVVDTTAPTLTLENPGSTGDTTPTLSGTTDLPEGSTVTLVVTDSAGNTQTINALVDANGSFSVDVPNALADGDFTVSATATDSAGNAANANTTGNVDSQAPLLTLDTQGATSDVTPTITGTTDVASGTLVTITVVDANGNSQSFQAAVQADGTFSADVPSALAEGGFTVTATVSDAQGNTATANETNGSIDTQAPIVTVNPLDSGNDTTPVISGNTDLPEGAVVVITVTDSNGDTQTINALVDADGNFATEVLSPLPEGDYDVEVTATDDAGNSTTVTEDGGNIDTTAPVLTLNPQGTGNDETPNISGSTDLAPGSTVTLTVTDSAGNTQTFDAIVDANGDFSADVPNAIPDGSYTVTASASDDAGNTTTTSDTGTLDTSAPALTLDAQVTVSDTTPTISGTTDLPAGSTVTLFVTDSAGNTQTFTALVDASGNFIADVPAPLAEGDYSVTATATDSNGNSASVTDNNGIVDTVAPVISLDVLGSNNDTTPTISGTTDLAAGESVTLSITDNAGNTQTVTATVDANGNFTVDVPAALAEGDYTVTVTATDDAGNSASANATGTIDTTAPTLSLDPQGLGNDTTPTISGSTDLAEGSVVSLVITDSAGNIQTVTATVDAAGNFTVDVPAALAEGSYSVEATATDEAGNSTSVLDNSGVIDITPPELNLDELTPENNATPTISGTTNLPAGAIVTLTVIDSAGNTQTFAATVQTDGSFAANVPSPLAEGDYTVTATAQDAAGNQGSDSETGGSVDTTAPVITLDPLGTGNDNTPTISGSTDLAAGSTVTITVTDSVGTVQTFTATVDANGDFSADVPNPMADGNFDVTATATDAAGNTATDTVSGDINSAAPTLSLDPLGSGNDTTPTISGDTDLAPGSTVTLTVTDSAGNTQTFSAIVQGDGSFTADVPASLPEGDYSVTATATDGAGNSASVTENGGDIDTTAPSITIDSQGLGNDATPSISGTTDLNAGDTVSISVTDNAGNTQTFTAIVQNDGTYSADVPADLAEGSFSVTVTATDDAGNSATAIDNNGIIDTAAPTVTLDAQGLTNDATPTISGTTDLAAGNTVSISVTDSLGNTQTFTATVQGNGSFSADVPVDLAEGDYTVEVTATDDAGNQNTAVDNNGTVDTTPPVVNLDPVASGNDATPVLSGTTDLPEGATITLVVTDAGGNVQNLTATVNADGTFSVEVPSALVDGDYDVTVSASDAAGNSTTVSDSGNINASAPDITLDALGQTNDATPLISGTTNAPIGAVVTLTVTDSAGAVQTFTATVQGDGTFSASVPSDLAEGSYTVEAEVTDGAGNTGSDSETGGVVDTTSPAIDLAEQGVGNDATPTISGTTDQPAGSTVSITVTDNAGNIQTLSAIVQIDGSFSVDVPTTLAEGNFTVQATVVDEAGNTASDAETGLIDTISPVLTLDEPGTVSDSTPTISGTVDLPQGSTVQITVVDSAGNTQVFSALVGAGGVFSADVPAAMAEGNFTVSATATDEAGNSTTDNEAGVVDTLVPTLTIDVADTTNDATPLITGTTDEPAGSVVTILVTDSAGATQTLSAVVQADGSFSISPGTDLAEGDFTVSATISDEAGNTATASDAGSIDITAPSLTLTPLEEGNDTTPTLSGSTNLAQGSEVMLVVTDSAGNVQTLTAIVDVNGNFTVDVPAPLAEGAYSVEATASDEAGNSTTVVDNTGIIDTTAPTLSLDTLAPDSDTTPTISGNTDLPAGATVTITVTDNAGVSQTFDATVQGDGSFSADVPSPMVEGGYTVTAVAQDPAGNETTATETNGSVDTIAPTINLDAQGTGNDTTPTITGSTDLSPGGSVTITVTDSAGAEQTFTAIVDSNGNFSADVPNAMVDGNFDVTATATDAAGNSASDTTSGNINTAVPNLTLDPLGTGNDTTPTISGTTDIAPGSAVSISVTDSAGNTQTFDAIVQANGTFSVDVPAALSEGNYSVTASATDGAGNTATANENGGVIDTTVPAASTVDAGNGTEITGTAEAGAVVNVDIDGDGTPDFTVIADGDGNWSVTPDTPLADGVVVTATATDEAGNTSAPASDTVDAVAPIVVFNDLTTNDTTPALTGSVDDPTATVVVTINGADYTATNNGDGTWTLADDIVAALAEGSYTATVAATDADGNTGTNSGTVVIDTTAPAAPTVDAGDGTEITGTAEAGSTVNVDVDGDGTPDFTVIADGDGNWSVTPTTPLADGVVVTATAVDESGNVSASASDTVDAVAPVVAINDLTTNDATPELTGTVDDPSAIVVVTIDGVDYTVTNNGDGSWTLADDAVAALADGSYTATVTATDADGNVGSNSGTVVIDTTPPAIPTVDAGNGTEITGTAEAGATVNVDVDGDGTPDFTVIADGDGNWSITPDTPLADGVIVTVTATDAAGNISNPASDTVDATAPVVAFNDLTTNDTTPALTGSVDDPTATVVVTINGSDYTATNNGDGTWTLADDAVAALAEGSYTATVTATDPEGNVGTNTGTVVIDTTAPAAPTVEAGNGTEITGTAEAGATVNVDVDGDGTPDFTVIADGDGNWSVTPDNYTATNNGDGTWTLADNIVALLAEGNYTAVVTATDAVGNSDSASGSVVIDTSIDENNNGQTVTFDSISNDSGVAGDFITSDSTLIFNGTVDLGDNTTLTVTVDGTSYTFGTDPELTIDGSGNWSLDLTGTTLPAGTYAVVATVTDEAGNSASTASQNVVVQALDAINDGNTVDMGEPVVTVNPPETTSNVDVIGLAEATGGVDASASFTVSPNHVGEVLVEVDQIALVAVADAYIVEVYDESGQLVYKGVSADSQLADVGGLDIFDVTGDETISFTLAGLDAGNYSVVVRNDENLLEDLLDNDNSNDVNLQELGSAGVVLGPDNQTVVLDTIETTLNTGVLGIPLGTVGTQVRGVLETLLDTTTVIGAGQLVNLLTAPLDAIGLTGFLDDILSVIADALLSNTLTLLQDTDITTTLTEYTYTGDLVAQGNLIDGDISGVGADTILDGAQVTLVTNASGDSVAVPATGTVTIQGNYGVLEIAADGTYTYTADGDRSAIGQDEVFNYTLSDGETSDIAALTITISGSDFPPVVAQTDNNDMELGAQTAIVNAPVSDSDFRVIGSDAVSPVAGSPEASTTLTVDAGFFGEVVVEVSQTALVAVADAYRIDIVDADGNVVATAMTPDNPLIGDVAGVNLIGVTGDDTLVAKFSGLPAGEYTVVVRNDESALETLFDQDSDGSIALTELGDGGVVLGEENQEVVLTAVEDTLNGTNASILNGLGLGTVVRNLVLEPALSTADTIGAGDLVSTITTGLNLLGLGALVDTVLDAVAAALLSNTLTLLQSTDITSTLTEYAFEGSTTTSGNVIDAANTGDVADSIAEGGVVTQVTHTNGESVTVLGTGLSGITIEGNYGDLTIFEDGSYTYVANGVRDGLGNTDSFSYTISDGRNTSTANLNFNLSGQGVSADSARAELTYDFVSEAGPSELDALSHGYLLGLGGNFSDTSNTFAVATNTTQDITLNVDNGSLLSLVSSLTITVEKFENGAWEAYRVFPNGELVSLLGIDGDTVLTVDGLTEGLYRLSMSGTTGFGVAGSISVDLSSTINYLDQFEVSGVQTATGNLFDNDILFGPTYDVTVSTDGTTFQDATGGITLVGDYGTLQIDETGAYTYTPNNTQVVFGGTLTDTFTYRIEYPDGTVEQAEFNVFVTASGEGVPEVVTTTSSESVSASDSSGTVVTDEPTAPDVIDLTGQTLQTVELNAETRLVTPENEPTAPLVSSEPVESIEPIETAPDLITLPEEEVSTLGTNMGDGFGGGDTIDLTRQTLQTVDLNSETQLLTPENEPTVPLMSTLPIESIEPVESAPDIITLPEEGVSTLGTNVSDGFGGADAIDLTRQTLQTVDLNAETQLVTPENEPTAPLMSTLPVESIEPIETAPDIITLPEEEVSSLGTNVGDSFGGGDTIDLSGTKIDTVDIGGPLPTAPNEGTSPLSPEASTPESTLPDDTITLPEEDDIVFGGPVTEVTVDLVDIDLPPEELILPSTEPTSVDSNGEGASPDASDGLVGDTSKESGGDVTTASPTESEVLKTAIDKLPPTDI
ncbi:Ig-like domain repeat protein [Alteromonas sp. Mex14]|nr:Ig-like domain repeat protein [Alteromonas sp. Mex14]